MEDKNLVTQSALKFGLIVGLIQVVLTLFSYVLGVQYMASIWVALSILVLFVISMVVSGVKWRTMNGGFITFKEMFGFLLLVFMASMAIITVFNILLYHVVEPELAYLMKEESVKNTVAMIEKFGGDEAAIDQAISSLDDFETKFTIKNLSIQFLWSIIWGLILSLILSAILKKNSDPFEESEIN